MGTGGSVLRAPHTTRSLDYIWGRGLVLVRRFYSDWELAWWEGRDRSWLPYIFEQLINNTVNNLSAGLVHSYRQAYALCWASSVRLLRLPPELPELGSHFHNSLDGEPEKEDDIREGIINV